MAMPYAHLDRLADLPAEAAHELIGLAQRTEQALERLYTRKVSISDQSGPGRRSRRRRTPPPARPAPLVRRHQLHDHHRRNTHPARRPGNHLEADAGGVCGTGGLAGSAQSAALRSSWQC